MNTEQTILNTETNPTVVANSQVFHIGWMRTGTTFLQGVFKNHADIRLSLKNRFFSYDPYFSLGKSYYSTLIHSSLPGSQVVVDSDENYAMGRFKTHLRETDAQEYNYKAELSYIHHDISKMIGRIKEVSSNAKIFGVVRKQTDWFESVYKHDVYHFGLDKNFKSFYASSLGQDYRNAADYSTVVEAYQKAFGEENVKILLFEDFVSNQALFVDELSDFLGVNITIDQQKKLKKNASTSNLFTRLHQKANLLSEPDPTRPERKLYSKLRSAIYRMDHLTNAVGIRVPTHVISKSMKKTIFNEYEESNRRLGRLLNKEAELEKYGYYTKKK